jgi:membrane-bound lytic murein transglycosylase A
VPLGLKALDFQSLSGWAWDDHLAALRSFESSARALIAGRGSPRPARPPPPALISCARAALGAVITAERDARRFFEAHFQPFGFTGENGGGFLTGYYEPCVPASMSETEEFRWPILGRPPDLVTFAPGEAPAGFPDGISSARRLSDGSLIPYDGRLAIERERRDPIVWLRDAVEAFLVHVQGAAQVEFADGRRAARLRRPQRPALYVDRSDSDRDR